MILVIIHGALLSVATSHSQFRLFYVGAHFVVAGCSGQNHKIANIWWDVEREKSLLQKLRPNLQSSILTHPDLKYCQNPSKDHLFEDVLLTLFFNCLNFGPSGVLALPLAAGINIGGHYFWYYSTLDVVVIAVAKIPEGVVVGFQIFAWAPN